MAGGLIQIVAIGPEDMYLTGNPQITYFKVVYRKHTNFSMEAIKQDIEGNLNTTASSLQSTITRTGDLLSHLWLDVELKGCSATTTNSSYHNWTNNTGHAFIKDVEVEIGGQSIDKHYSQWFDVWNELTDHDEKEWIGLNKHSAKNSYLSSSSPGITSDLRLYIPLKFWFCRNPGLALPIIALQYSDTIIKINTRSINSLLNSDSITGVSTTAPTLELWGDYIFLDTDERRRFAETTHEYLIEQLQRSTGNPSTTDFVQTLNFTQPIKELIWTFQNTTVGEEINSFTGIDAKSNSNTSVSNGNDYFNYGSYAGGTAEKIGGITDSNEAFQQMTLLLNGQERFIKRNASYFRTCQPIQAGHKIPTKHIYCYTFALNPEDHQPSGTCNFSRMDDATLNFDSNVTGCNLTVWAVNYNVLRIMSGIGGLAYVN